MPYTWNLQTVPILFEQIFPNLTNCIYALRSTFCIVSNIFNGLYALCPAPNFYEIHPRHWFLVSCKNPLAHSAMNFLHLFILLELGDDNTHFFHRDLWTGFNKFVVIAVWSADRETDNCFEKCTPIMVPTCSIRTMYLK
jgi:hypothetical protein